MSDKIIKNMRIYDPTNDELYFQAHITKDFVADIYNIDVKVGSRRKLGIHMDTSLSILLNDKHSIDKKTFKDDNEKFTMNINSNKAGNTVLIEFSFQQNLESDNRFNHDNVNNFIACSGITVDMFKNDDDSCDVNIYSSSSNNVIYCLNTTRIKSVNTDIVNDSMLFSIDDNDQLKYTENDCLGNENRGIRICGTITPVAMDVEERDSIGYYEVYAALPTFAASVGLDHEFKTLGNPIVKTEALLYDNRYSTVKTNEDIASTVYSLAVDRI